MKNLKLRVRWKERSLEEFVASHAEDFTDHDFFLQTTAPLDEGTEVGFEFLLADGRCFFAGRGVVSDGRAHNGRSGMTIRHTLLSAAAEDLLAALAPPAWEDRTPVHPVHPELLEDGDRFEEDTATGLEEDARDDRGSAAR